MDDARRQVQTPDGLGRHILPRVNSFLAGHNFHLARQMQDESVNKLISRCRVLAAKCKFTDILEVNTRFIEQLIIGTKHVIVQEKLL